MNIWFGCHGNGCILNNSIKILTSSESLGSWKYKNVWVSASILHLFSLRPNIRIFSIRESTTQPALMIWDPWDVIEMESTPSVAVCPSHPGFLAFGHICKQRNFHYWAEYRWWSSVLETSLAVLKCLVPEVTMAIQHACLVCVVLFAFLYMSQITAGKKCDYKVCLISTLIYPFGICHDRRIL